MEKGPYFALAIQRMPEGGYLVVDDPLYGSGDIRRFYYAATTIDEALRFIRNKLAPGPTLGEVLAAGGPTIALNPCAGGEIGG